MYLHGLLLTILSAVVVYDFQYILKSSRSKIKNMKNPDAERLNPCLKEQEKSYQCLNKNGFDHEKCEPYFDNYNTCKKFWGKVFKDRRARGIVPYLPEIEDREKVKAEYIQKMGGKLT